MSVRRAALADIGGFHSDNHDDMDMCHRLKDRRPAEQIVYEPMARVQHFVPRCGRHGGTSGDAASS